VAGATDHLLGLKENVIIGKLIPARAHVNVPERRVPEPLGPASFFSSEVGEPPEEGERPAKLPEGFVEELHRELLELRSGYSGLEQPEQSEEEEEHETVLDSEPAEDNEEAEGDESEAEAE
jgi:hypothetical protein